MDNYSGDHISEDRLETYASSDPLPDPELASIEEHLLVCDSCQDRVLELDAFMTAMRRALAIYPHRSFPAA